MALACKTFLELSSYELYGILQLRQRVFVVEQGCVFLDCDGLDVDCHHLLLTDDGALTGYVRLLPPGVAYETAGIGRIVLAKQARGSGLGVQLVNAAIVQCEQLYNAEKITITAQAPLAGYYAQFEFREISEPYMYEGLLHITMQRG